MIPCNHNYELGQFLKEEDEAFERGEAIDLYAKQIYSDALWNEKEFITIVQNYGLEFDAEIMRMLRNLSFACKGEQTGMDAITTALSQIESKLKHACEHMAGRD